MTSEWLRRVACVECGLSRHPAMPCARCGCYCETKVRSGEAFELEVLIRCDPCRDRELAKSGRFSRVVLFVCVAVLVAIVTHGVTR